MAGTPSRRNSSGSGHGARNHKHASGKRLVAYFYAMFHVRWRPERIETKQPKSASKNKAKFVKDKANRRKQ